MGVGVDPNVRKHRNFIQNKSRHLPVKISSKLVQPFRRLYTQIKHLKIFLQTVKYILFIFIAVCNLWKIQYYIIDST